MRASEHTGAQVPATVTRRHILRPTTSESFPNRGHEMKASSPRTHSANPIIRYTLSSNLCRSKDGKTALVKAKARNSKRSTGSTYKCWYSRVVSSSSRSNDEISMGIVFIGASEYTDLLGEMNKEGEGVAFRLGD